jgi:hypothetical protein
MEQLTHWKKLTNPNYLGSYALLPGQELVATIDLVKNEEVIGPEGKKEVCSVLHFKEGGVKPMILNATNFKTIAKLFKTPYIEHWVGRQIIIYSEKVKAFGEVVDALRIRPYLPTPVTLTCADCGGEIEGYGKTSAETVAKHTLAKYGRALCSACATKAAEAQKQETDEGVL